MQIFYASVIELQISKGIVYFLSFKGNELDRKYPPIELSIWSNDNERVTHKDVPEGQCWEIQEGEPQIVNVQGRLKQSLVFWQETLQAPSMVLEWIQIGYKLPLQYLPDPYSQSNHTSALSHHSFVTEAISQLLTNRCVRKVDEKPYFVARYQLCRTPKVKSEAPEPILNPS